MIERKSREDAVSTIIHARKRFHTELGKMRSAAQAGGLAVVIVESGLPELLRLNPNVHKKSLVASLASIHVRFGVPVLFCGNRGVASFYAERLMMDWWNAFGIKGSAAMADGEASS